MNRPSRRTIAALSLANLLLLREFALLLYPGNEAYLAPELRPVYLGSLLSAWALLSIAAYWLFGALDRAKGKGRLAGNCFFFSSCLLVVSAAYEVSRLSARFPYFSKQHFLGDWGTLGNALKIALLAATALVIMLRQERWLGRFCRALLIWSAPFILVTFGQIAFFTAKYSYLRHLAHVGRETASPRRLKLVWIIFDEMSERLAGRDRPADLKLPALDRLRAQALTADAAFSPASYTIASLPALIEGRLVSNATLSGRYDLHLQFCGTPSDGDLGDAENFFSRMRAAGFRSSIVGWRHPYCRVLGTEVDRCRAYDGTVDYLESVSGNLPVIFQRVLSGAALRNGAHHRTYLGVWSAVESFLKRRDTDIFFMHWPLPHAPRIELKPGDVPFLARSPEPAHPPEGYEFYYHNLVLADDTLAELRRRMEASGDWDNATVLVSSDHWWRTDPTLANAVLRHDLASFRVPFILKLPRQTAAFHYQRPFNTVVSEAMLRAVLQGAIAGASDAVAWLDRNAVHTPTQPTPPFFHQHPDWNCASQLPEQLERAYEVSQRAVFR